MFNLMFYLMHNVLFEFMFNLMINWNAPRALRQAETRVMWPVGYSKLENRSYRKRYNNMCTDIRGNISIYGLLG